MGYNIQIKKTEKSRLNEIDFDNLVFGRQFSDHMFVADYKDGEWVDLRVIPYGNISLSPANMTLHYAQTIFEGLKATKDEDGNPMLLRPEMNARRLNTSAVRMSMPHIPEELFLQALDTLISLDKDWIPVGKEKSLYIRPFMFATDEYVGVKTSDTYRFYIITTPVASYYSKPVSLLASEKYIRAAHGGVGEAKTGGNYAATLLPVEEAHKQGFDQILWLDAKDFRYIQECGTMNLFFQINGKIITPSTDGAILHGITRDSVIQILKEKGITIEERQIDIEEIMEAGKNGTLEDAFGTGTAAVITFVADITFRDTTITLPPVDHRIISNSIKNEISGLRNGDINDSRGWIRKIIPANSIC